MRAGGNGTAWGPILAFFGANVLFGAGLFFHAFLYNFYLDELGRSEAVMGGAAAALTVGGLVALVPAGLLVDRLGSGVAYILASVLAASGLAAGALVSATGPVFLAAALAGAGTSGWRVAMGPMLMRLAGPAWRSRAFSWNVAALLASGAIWTATAGALPDALAGLFGEDHLGGLRGALLLGALATGLGGGVMLVSGPRSRSRSRPPTDRGTRPAPTALRVPWRQRGTDLVRSLRVPRTVAFAVLMVWLWMTAAGLVIPFLNLYFLRVHGLDLGRIGALFGGAQALTAAVVFLSGELAGRWGTLRTLTAWTVVLPPALLGLAAGAPLGAAVGLYLVQGFVPPATNPLIDEILLERVAEDRRGAVSSWRNAATELSGLVGSGLGGVLLQVGSFTVLLGLAGGVAVAGAVGLTLSLRSGAGGGG